MSNLASMGFNARQVAPDAGQQDPVPAGWYKAAIVKSEVKPTKDTTGMRLEMQFKIIEGQFANRMVFEGLNVQNTNPVAQEIAFKQLSAVCHAVGKVDAQDSSELHNIPMQIKVSLKPAGGGYEAKNEIKAYKHISEVIAASPVAAVAPAAFGAGVPPPAAFGAPAAIPPAATTAAAPGQTWVPPAAVQPWAATGAPAAAAVPPVAQAPVALVPPAATAPVVDPVAAAQAVLAAAQAAAAEAQAQAAQAAAVAAAAAAGAALTPPAWTAAAVAPAAEAVAPVAAAPAAAVAPGAGITPPWATPAA